ncbi:MAG: aspartate aminotransferase family protein [Lachnospiraceae bacterium]|nr:aspartate aminotransferase family protein [Lachnospiraceae bacterium]
MLRTDLPKVVSKTVPGPKTLDLIKRKEQAVPKALCGATYPVSIVRGEGAMFEDLDGNRFLDWIGGVGVLNIGYSNEEVVGVIKAQAEKYTHTIFNIIGHEGYIELAEKFNEIVPVKGDAKKTYFVNSGAEADENAIKVAKAFTKKSNVICFSGAFHGRTNLTMALTAKKAYSLGMGPFPAGIYRAEFPNMYHAPKGYSYDEAIQYYIQKIYQVFDEATPANEVACILVEPIQGEGGFIPAPIEWVKAVRKICDDNGILLIADEVQCGNCRSGHYFVSEMWAEAGAAPDILTTAKSMGAGMPISAVCARAEIMDSVIPGTIGGTYAGNPVSCAAALKTMEIYKEEKYTEKAKHIGEVVSAGFKELMKKYPVIGDVRGIGAMLGVEFVKDPGTKEPYGEFVSVMIKHALQMGLLLENAGTNGNVIRFLAPLCMTDEQMEKGLEIYETAITKAMDELGLL